MNEDEKRVYLEFAAKVSRLDIEEQRQWMRSLRWSSWLVAAAGVGILYAGLLTLDWGWIWVLALFLPVIALSHMHVIITYMKNIVQSSLDKVDK